MVKGLYTAASGMMLQMARQDLIANNIANVSTSGYKKQVAVSRAFPDMLISRMENGRNRAGYKAMTSTEIGTLGSGACLDTAYIDFSKGNLLNTDNSFDLAMGGEGYFAVDTPQGECFTRSGAFKIDFDGLLVTSQGYPLLDDFDNYIYVEDDFTVDRMGNFMLGGEEAGRIKTVVFDDERQLQKIGDNLFTTDQEYFAAEHPEVMQGYMEQSNVNAVGEMVRLMNAVRVYETLQKVVQAEDELNQAAINQVGSSQ